MAVKKQFIKHLARFLPSKRGISPNNNGSADFLWIAFFGCGKYSNFQWGIEPKIRSKEFFLYLFTGVIFFLKNKATFFPFDYLIFIT